MADAFQCDWHVVAFTGLMFDIQYSKLYWFLGRQKVIFQGQGLFGVSGTAIQEQILEKGSCDQNAGEAHDLLKRFLGSRKGCCGQKGPSDT